MALTVMTKKEFYEQARKLYGDDPKDWVFVCPWCKFKQSMNSILASIETNGFHKSQRYGIITMKNIKELQPKPEQECLSPDCNYASYGLFGGSLEINDHRYLELAKVN